MRIVDTTLRDGSHAIAHRYRASRCERSRGRSTAPASGRSPSATATASAPSSIQYGRPLHSDAELLAAAAGVDRAGARSRSRSCRGSGPSATSRRARDAGAERSRASRRVCTEADIGVQHLGLARELGMAAHSHLNTAHLLDPAGTRRAGPDRGRRGQPGRLHRRLGRRVPDRRRAPPDRRDARGAAATTSPSGIHEHNNLSLAVANSAAAIEEGATLVDTSLAGARRRRRERPDRGARGGARADGHPDRDRPVGAPGRRRRRRPRRGHAAADRDRPADARRWATRPCRPATCCTRSAPASGSASIRATSSSSSAGAGSSSGRRT